MRLLVSVLLAAVVSLGASPGRAGDSQRDRVTVIGDSVLTAVLWNPKPLAVLEHGLPSIDLQIGVCRTLTGVSCPFEGSRVPTLLDVVHTLGPRLGSTVVVEVGYNDAGPGFTSQLELSLDALVAAGAQRILWVNYHDMVPEYRAMNAALERVAASYPSVTIVDWQRDSLNQYSWFQSDGIHLVYSGAMALATLIHTSLEKALAPPLVAEAPPSLVEEVGRPFRLRLAAAGGIPPYAWSVTSGPLPRGLHLLAGGVLYGTARQAGTARLRVAVTDALGQGARERVTLSLRPRGST